jgi:hypothetical protein
MKNHDLIALEMSRGDLVSEAIAAARQGQCVLAQEVLVQAAQSAGAASAERVRGTGKMIRGDHEVARAQTTIQRYCRVVSRKK